jgi:glycerol uptake facilitator-like aquaporin
MLGVQTARSLTAEFVGTAMLLTLIVGSGIQVERLGVDATAQLLAHTVAVGVGLAVLVAVFLPVSGSQFNPAVTLVAWANGSLAARLVPGYLIAQVGGAVTGVAIANLTFGLSAFEVATTDRPSLFGAEVLATFSLVLAIFALVAAERPSWLPGAVGGIVAAGMLATASTGFANPAVTVARVFSDTYTGISPTSVPEFLAAQLIGAGLAGAAVLWWFPSAREDLDDE